MNWKKSLSLCTAACLAVTSFSLAQTAKQADEAAASAKVTLNQLSEGVTPSQATLQQLAADLNTSGNVSMVPPTNKAALNGLTNGQELLDEYLEKLRAANGLTILTLPSGPGTDFVFDANAGSAFSFDEVGDPDNETYTVNNADDTTYRSVAWTATIESLGASWCSEPTVGITLPGDVFFGGITLGAGNAPCDPNPSTFAACLNFADAGAPDITGTLGDWTFEFFEGFDDTADAVDANITGFSMTFSKAFCPGSTGACCTGLTCTDETAGTCAAGGGSFFGTGTTCDAMDPPNQCDCNDNGIPDADDLLPGAAIPFTQVSGAGIPDDGAPAIGLTDTQVLADPSVVTDVNVEVNITHTWNSDLTITLQYDDGSGGAPEQEAILSANNGGSGDNYINTVFDDAAATAIAGLGAASAPFTGSFQPEQSLAVFNGETIAGSWSLFITDGAGGDVGTLDSWTLSFNAGPAVSTDCNGNSVLDECEDPDPNTVGACCNTDGSCTLVTEAECNAASGVFQGLCTDCDSVACPQPGACCLADGSCTDGIFADACVGAGDIFTESTVCPGNGGGGPTQQLIISEIVDATESGGLPKYVELTNTGCDDVDLSDYSIGNINNGAATMGFDALVLSGILAPGDSYTISYENSDSAGMSTFFDVYGFDADNLDNGSFINGDDVIVLFLGAGLSGDAADGSGTPVADVYGVVGTDGTGQPWDYTDGWARRNASSVAGNGGSFSLLDWTFGGADSLDGAGPAGIVAATDPGAHTFETPTCGAVETDCSGSCCRADGSCDDGVNLDDCSSDGDVFNGPGSTCDDVACNDDCATAQLAIDGYGAFAFSNVGATNDGPVFGAIDDCFDAFGNQEVNSDVWYCWTAPCDGDVTIDTCDTFDTRLAVYVGCACPTDKTNLAGCNDDFENAECAAGTTLASAVTFSAAAGQQYLVQVGSFSTFTQSSGDFNINGESCCGDGVLDMGEECDNGSANSDTNPDACRTDCTLPVCGDGVQDTGEECDNGAANSDTNPDACRTTCVLPACGDGVTDSGEDCDDANADNTDACLDTCVDASCGDGFVQAGVEECDDANADNTDACLDTCVNATCGDGFVQAGVEECDDANADNTDSCLDTCVNATCGDGFVQAGVEECDDANADNTDDCLDTCVNATCGDGFTQAGVEECDDGMANSDTTPDACRTTCVLPACGDDVVDSGEECDNGAANSDTTPDACRTTCENPSCGDDVVDTGEECDNGALNSNTEPNACRLSCNLPSCGDNVTDNGEACDDGGESATCDDDCTDVECGDGNTNEAAGEDCDDSGASATCDVDCSDAICGDGTLNLLAGEECDDGNNDDGDLCNADCTLPGAAPVPAMSQWGMLLLSILLVVALGTKFRRNATTA